MVGGRRGGKVDHASMAFLTAVKAAVASGPCWVKLGRNAPVSFRARLALTGVPVVVDESTVTGAQLFDGEPPDEVTSA